jgi:NADPH-dependent FMN reductase
MSAYQISVDDYLRKGQGGGKLLVLRGYRRNQEREANWMADQVVRSVRSMRPDIEIADWAITDYRLCTGVSNDPEDQHFDLKDQFPLFLEPLAQADAVLLVSREHGGFPDSNIVRLTERLAQTLHSPLPEPVKRAFSKTKPVGVLVYGTAGAHQAAAALLGAWVHFGCTVPKRGMTCYDAFRGDITKAADIGQQLMILARGLFSGM